jgi:hypothetical protein
MTKYKHALEDMELQWKDLQEVLKDYEVYRCQGIIFKLQGRKV